MAVRGAIFDCDGTLIDSMPMWTQTCVALLERYGVKDAQCVFEEHESLDMDKKCFWYHEHLGIGASGEALFRELWEMVEREYRTSVQPLPGCRAFLESLRAANVPMVVASSTPPELLSLALETHGLLQFFDDLVFAGDVGRGKEYPDVYLAACERLGTEREHTWVFEDAPFGMRSAARVGFPVVGVLNDHDGRDVGFVERWATVVARGYEQLAPCDLNGMAPKTCGVLIVAGSPQRSSRELVRRLAGESDVVIAADKGSEALMEAGVSPHVYCGDDDSIGEEALEWVRGHAGRMEEFNPLKDDTDLGLAFSLAKAEADARGMAPRVTVTCASGGRPDHALGVWGVLAREATTAPRVVEDGYECRVLSREGSVLWTLEGLAGRTVSVLALAPGTVVSEHGMLWNLDRRELEVLSDLGVSNRIVDDRAEVRCHSGVAAVFLV